MVEAPGTFLRPDINALRPTPATALRSSWPSCQRGGPEIEWLPFMRLLRNKAEHIGQPVFRQIGLHDATPKFYTFMPRRWPYIWERHMKRRGESVPEDPRFLEKFFLETLVHQDIVTYAKGLRRKVQNVIH